MVRNQSWRNLRYTILNVGSLPFLKVSRPNKVQNKIGQSRCNLRRYQMPGHKIICFTVCNTDHSSYNLHPALKASNQNIGNGRPLLIGIICVGWHGQLVIPLQEHVTIRWFSATRLSSYNFGNFGMFGWPDNGKLKRLCPEQCEVQWNVNRITMGKMIGT